MSKSKDLIREAVVRAAVSVAEDATTSTKRADIQTITTKVTDQIAPIVEHLANNEPWYRSRVTIGALVSMILPALGLIGVTSDVIDAEQLTTVLLALGTVLGGVLTLYGRWKAKRPLGK